MMRYLIKGKRDWGTDIEGFFKPTGYCLVCRKTERKWKRELWYKLDAYHRANTPYLLSTAGGYLVESDLRIPHLIVAHGIERTWYYNSEHWVGGNRVVH